MRRLLSFLALSATILTSVCSAQQPPDTTQSITTLKTTARLVTVDVTVTDQKGNSIRGLTCADFRLLDRKTPQTLHSCEDHTNPEIAPAASPMPLPQNVFSNATSPSLPPTLDIFVFDFLNAGQTGEYASSMRDAAKNLLATAIPGHRTAVFALGSHLQLVSGFSDDSARSEAIQSKLIAASTSFRGTAPAAVDSSSAVVVNPGVALASSIPDSLTLDMQAKMRMQEEAARLTIGQLREIAAYVTSLPGRKRLIWVSGSSAFTFGEGDRISTVHFDAEAFVMLLKLSREFADARVQVFPVDSSGVVNNYFTSPSIGGEGSSRDSGGPVQAGANSYMAEIAYRARMDAAADETGGKAFYGNNGLDSLFKKALDTGNQFYTLTYNPPEVKPDGSFHEFHITVPGRKLRLRYRRGYLAPDAERERIVAQFIGKHPSSAHVTPTRIATAMTRGLPNSTSLVFQVRVDPIEAGRMEPVANTRRGQPTGPELKYEIDFWINATDIVWTASGDLQTASLRTNMVIYDRKNEQVDRIETPAYLHLTAEQMDFARSHGVRLHMEKHFVLNPGMHLRLGVEDLNNHHLGTVEIDGGSLKPVTPQERAATIP